jgi:hypothetical protein
MVYTAGAAFQFWTSSDGLTWSGGTASSLLFSYTYAQGVGLGGMSGSASNSGYGRTAGMTIEAVAIYRGVALTTVKARNCHFDSEYTTQDYKKWAYANSVLTFAKGADGDIGSGSTPLKSFSIATGTDGSDTYYGGGNTAYFGTTFWHNYCCNQSSYSAPGCVLRVTSAVAVSAGFSYGQGPLTLGGLIIESSADGCSFPGTSQSTVLGSASESSETWFGINGNASISRNGFLFLSGAVNIDVAEGKSFSLNASQSTAAYYPTIKGSVTTANTATGAGTDGGVLRMHGLGTITVPTLIASNEATLDFSDVQENATVVRSTTPFIQGNLTVDATTKLVFPAGLAEGAAYKICSGTLTAPAKTVQTSVQVGTGNAFTAYVTYNASDKTVSYSTSAPTYTGTVDGSTITWDRTPSADDLADGNVVLTGSGEVTLDAEPISINAASGVTVDITGYEDAVFSGAGTFKFSYGYRTHVPSGMTYQYVGSNDSANPTAIAGVTVDGTLKTSGYVSLTSLVIDAAGTLDVLSESTTVSTTNRSNGEGNLSGTIVIRSGATMVNATGDGLDWGGTTRVDIYGTLSMENTRWSIRDFDNCQINLYPGAQVTGAGDGNGVFDLFNASSKLNMYAGTSGGTATISGPVRLRNSGVKYPIWIASGATLELSGGTLGNGGFSMNGTGELKLSGTMGHSGDSLVQDGTVTLDNIATAIPITVNSGKTLAVIATEAETIVPINATIAATGSIISSSGSGKVSGNIGFSSFSASQLNSKASGTLGAFLTGSSWTGTVTVPANVASGGTQVYLANLGNSNSTIALNGLSGSTHWIGGGSFPAELKIVGNVTFNNGGSGMNAVIGKVSGTDSTKTLTVAAWEYCTGATYTINDLSEYEGAISVDGSSLSSGTFKLVIGNITKALYSYGTALVTCSTTPGTYGTTTIDLSNTTLNNAAANLVFDTDGIYLAEAAYNGVNYKTLAGAVSAAVAASADPSAVTVYNSAATIPNGYALVTAAGGAMTLRSAGSGELIYWASTNSGDWSGEASNGTHTFYTAEGGTSTTPYVAGDTVVFTSNIQIWSKTAAHGAKFQIGTDTAQAEVHFTRSGDNCDNYILDGSTIEIKSGSTLVAERYGYDGSTHAYTAWDSYQNEHPDATAINDTTISGAGTLKIGGDTGGHGAAAAILSGTSTIADTVTIEFADGATLSVPSVSAFSGSGVVTLDVSDVTHDVDGVTLITFTDTTPSDASKFSCSAVLAIENDALKVYPVAAVINPNTDGVVGTYSTVQEAIDVAVANVGSWYYAKVYQSASVSVSAVSVLIMLADEDVELQFTTDPGFSIQKTTDYSEAVPGLWGYNKRATDATFTWDPDTAEGNWTEASNWKIGGVVAGRAPGQNNTASDAVVFNSSASVSVPSDVSHLSGITIATDNEDGVVLTGNDEVWAGSVVTVGEGGIVLASATSKLITQYISFGETAPNTSVANYVVKTQANTPSAGKTQYTVVLGAATIGGVAYETLAEALAVEGETTIWLVQNVTGDVELRLGQTLLLNGNTISGDVSGNVSYAVPVYNSMASAWYCVDNRTNSWIGTSGGSWDIVAGWYNGVVPGSDTAVTINSFATAGDPTTTGTIMLADNFSVKSITLGEGVALTLNKSGESAVTLTTTEAIVLSSGQTITTGSGVTLSPTPVSGEDLMYVKTTISEGATTYALQVAGEMDGTTAKIDDATAEVTVPVSATAIEADPAVSSIKLEDGSAITAENITIKYNGTTDITDAFTVTVADNQVTIALNENGSVTISADTITVKPAVAASEPMTMPGATTAPSFNIKTIPGLYYVVRSGTDPSSLTAGSATQATTTTTGLAGPALSNEDTVRYYQISVGRTAAEAAEAAQ